MSTEIHSLKINQILERVGRVIGDHKNESIAKALGVAPTTASNWKTRNTIPWEELWQFCNEQHMSLEWILTGSQLSYGSQNGKQGENANKGGDAVLTEKYERIIKHYEVIIENQAKQIELFQQVLKSGQRSGDPSNFDPTRVRKTNPF